MPIVRQRCLRFAILLFAAIAAFSFDVVVIANARALNAAELAAQTNREGMVTIKVTPQVFSGTTLRFEVILDTHSVALSQDMREVAVLSGGGNEYQPTAWEGDPPGGHHRKGVLVFAPISPMPASLTLKIRGVAGVPERVFTWAVSP